MPRFNTDKLALSDSFNENIGIEVIVEGKYVVVVSSENYRGNYWTIQSSDESIKYECLKEYSQNMNCLASGKYQLEKIINGKKVYFYTNINTVATEFSDVEARGKKIYEILDKASNTIVEYDKSSFSIDKVVKDEFTKFNLKPTSYKYITFYCPDANITYNASIRIDNYIFKLLFKSINENQQFNYKLSDYTIGNNSVGYYSSGSHTNLTIQNLENNIYKNDYLVISELLTPKTEERNIIEYAPTLLNKVFK